MSGPTSISTASISGAGRKAFRLRRRGLFSRSASSELNLGNRQSPGTKDEQWTPKSCVALLVPCRVLKELGSSLQPKLQAYSHPYSSNKCWEIECQSMLYHPLDVCLFQYSGFLNWNMPCKALRSRF